MYRPDLRCMAIGLLASLTVAEFLQAQGQLGPISQQPVLQQPIVRQPATNPGQQTRVAPGVPAVQATQNPAQLGQPRQAVAPTQQANPPIQLTEVEKQFVNQILVMWENASAQINTFDCRFERLKYDSVFGPGNSIPITQSFGQLTYSKPDKGSFKINEIRRWTKKDEKQQDWEPGSFVEQKEEVGEHWVCDGKAVFEYNHSKKQLEVNPLPPEMRGTAIADGPLPFLFGAKADKLNQRYWIRSKQSDPQTIWLEAYPRRQTDAANYSKVDIMLERKTMLPKALQVHMPNRQSRDVYKFNKPTVNGTLNKLFALFNAPRTPIGWKRIVHELPPAAPQATQPQETKQR